MLHPQYDTLLDPREFVTNILASRDIYQENGRIVYNVTFMNYPNFHYLRKMSFSYSHSWGGRILPPGENTLLNVEI